MAEVWFAKLDSLAKEGVNIDELKNDLKGVTLIGEYVGSQEH